MHIGAHPTLRIEIIALPFWKFFSSPNSKKMPGGIGSYFLSNNCPSECKESGEECHSKFKTQFYKLAKFFEQFGGPEDSITLFSSFK